jgi:hypothetical protein
MACRRRRSRHPIEGRLHVHGRDRREVEPGRLWSGSRDSQSPADHLSQARGRGVVLRLPDRIRAGSDPPRTGRPSEHSAAASGIARVLPTAPRTGGPDRPRS